MRSARFMLRVASFAASFVAISAAPSDAQLVPHDRWRTIETPHFRVHFTSALAEEARRGAVDAEWAWAQLSRELQAPRGKVDLVIADNVDYVNGYATPFPGNRIVIYAHPPIDAPELRNYDDWSRLVITHELTHVFHLDRAEGLWRLGRQIFGRHPALFPNAYQPAWVVEGLAVYYESRLTPGGRLDGTAHYMVARAAAEARQVPRLGEISRATSRFPGGETVYAYGGQIFDFIARTRGPEKISDFIDITSRGVVPFSLNRRAKRAFGISFENAWSDWRDSLLRAARPASGPLPDWRELTREGRYAEFPRWLGDTAILYVASTGREVTSAYSVSLDGAVRRLGRRNGLDVNDPLPDGSIVFAQPDYVDPFHFRTDLYVTRGGRDTRLTRGARLAHPDVRADGEIVAVQSTPGSTRLVRVSRDGRSVRPITVGTADVQWGEPRWSPARPLIAAIRVRRGGISELVVLDTLGSVVSIMVTERAIVATPSWSPDGNRLFYTSTRNGSQQAYTAQYYAGAAGEPRNGHSIISQASTGVFSPELSLAGKLAALSFRFDGFHVGYTPALHATGLALETIVRSPRPGCIACSVLVPAPAPISVADLPQESAYSPWRSLAPHYWEPLVAGSSGTEIAVGAATSGEDIVGRHRYYTELLYAPGSREAQGFATYQYAGLGQPYLTFSASQQHEHFAVLNTAGEDVGDLARRERIIRASASLVRPRARTSASLSLGGDMESRTYGTDPDTLLARLPELFGTTRRYPSVFLSGGWNNTRRPGLAISREDGITLSVTGRQRWEAGEFGDASRSIIGVASAYKSLDLPGFAHHVVALRGAAGYADARAISTFSAGGLSGGSLDVLAGLALGETRRTFGIRGFPPSAEQGIRAFAGTVEYRAPIAAPSRRVRFIPVLFDRISVAAFADAGRAYCPASADESPVCFPHRGGPWLASAGAELDIDTAIQHDVPARFRAGIAVPVVNRDAGRAKAASFYFTVGNSF